jgi:hypothetical protein
VGLGSSEDVAFLLNEEAGAYFKRVARGVTSKKPVLKGDTFSSSVEVTRLGNAEGDKVKLPDYQLEVVPDAQLQLLIKSLPRQHMELPGSGAVDLYVLFTEGWAKAYLDKVLECKAPASLTAVGDEGTQAHAVAVLVCHASVRCSMLHCRGLWMQLSMLVGTSTTVADKH